MFRNGEITYEGIGGLDFRDILKKERTRRGWMKPLVPAVSIPPPSPKVAETRPKKVDKKKTHKTPIVMEEDVDDVEEMEPPLEEPESPVVDEREEQIQPEVPSPDKETSESPESEELDYDLEDVMDVVNGNVDFGEDSEEEEENGTAVEEERRKKNAEKWLRGAKRIWDAAFSDESATSEEETDDRAELCEGPAKRKKVVTRTNSVKFYEEKYVEMHSFGKPRGGEGWWICKADARFAKRSYKAKRRSYGVPHCTNCGMKKHTATKCPEPQKRKGCIVCDSDRHKAQSLAKCPSKICHRCLGTDHDPQGCPGVKSKCQICKTWNHVESACTDFWRRFHQTTSGIIPIAASLTGSPLPKKFLWTSLRLVHSYAPVVGKKPAGLPKSKSAPSSLNKMVETPKQEQRSQEAADDEESPLLLEEEDEEMQVVPPPPRKVNVVTVDSDDNPTDDDEKVFLLSDSDCEDPNSDVQRMLNAGIVGTSAGAAANSSNGANQPQNQWNDVNGGQSPQVQNFTRRVEGEEMVFEVRGNRGAGGGFRGKNRHSRGFPRSPVNQDSGSGGRPPRGTPRGNKRRPWGVSRGGSSGPAQNGQRSNSQGQQSNEATGNRGGFRGGRGGFRGAGGSAPNGQRPNFQGHQANEAAGNRGGFRGGRGGFRGGRGARGNAANGSQNRGISGGSSASWRGSTPRGGNSGSDGSVRWNGRRVGKNR